MRKIVFFLVVVVLILVLTIIGCQEPEYVLPKTQKTIPRDTKFICIFFDDGWMNQYSNALPILLTRNFKATFGIITGSINTGTGLYKYASNKEILELAKYGMDVACHSKTHPHLTANLGDNLLRDEIIDSKKYLESLGLDIHTFIYPF